jgi:hypothetical protein
MFALGPLEESFPRTRASSVALPCDQSGHGEKSRPVSDQYPFAALIGTSSRLKHRCISSIDLPTARNKPVW